MSSIDFLSFHKKISSVADELYKPYPAPAIWCFQRTEGCKERQRVLGRREELESWVRWRTWQIRNVVMSAPLQMRRIIGESGRGKAATQLSTTVKGNLWSLKNQKNPQTKNPPKPKQPPNQRWKKCS